ncbi:ABC transporter substrate-binding protein [Streptomyces sp. ALI-76-A]|jgi:NitT/TauT family transport system substrate-binding protein|uniref:ABC transporter substrate-binding protein n=1 Tax=Streptomyces sp. ALI-76-A TaxID=3025736 RepID=UPI00256F475C|nr:ABC transporter substrate-binding protein [Streptomyces sp. ALI-76-A]MDL5204101.1 ABC transporter substrate-binding protein [Streptomyces sp. ALI-76-A]
MRRIPRLPAALLAVVLTAALASSCGSGDDSGGDGGSSSGGPAPDRVTYLTGFGTFGREAYAYVAQDKGWFEDAGVDVTIEPGQGSGSSLAALVGGRVQFAPIDLSSTIIQLGGGRISGVTAVAAIHQTTDAAVMALADSGVEKPADLEGRKVADPAGSVIGALFPAYAKLAGFDADKVDWVNLEPQQLGVNLASGSVDAVGQYRVGRPNIENAVRGKEVVVLPFGTYLSESYGAAVTTTTKIATEDPDLVRRFTTALLKGMRYAIDHPREAAKLMHDKHPTVDEKTAAAEIGLVGTAVRPAEDGAPIGTMERDRVAGAIRTLVDAGAVRPGLEPEQLVSFDLVPKS